MSSRKRPWTINLPPPLLLPPRITPPPSPLTLLTPHPDLYPLSFKNEMNNPRSSPAKNTRQCLGGHWETIYCLALSPCGKFLASAFQDSTVRVWYANNNCPTNTLRGNGTNHEFLRVIWAGIGWVGKGERRGGYGEGGLETAAAGMTTTTTDVAK